MDANSEIDRRREYREEKREYRKERIERNREIENREGMREKSRKGQNNVCYG
jgi:hypothetical protein